MEMIKVKFEVFSKSDKHFCLYYFNTVFFDGILSHFLTKVYSVNNLPTLS